MFDIISLIAETAADIGPVIRFDLKNPYPARNNIASNEYCYAHADVDVFASSFDEFCIKS